MNFITQLLPLLQLAMELGLKYGPDIAALISKAIAVAGGEQPTEADFAALHALRDKIDVERHKREAEAQK